MGTVLVIDDEQSIIWAFEKFLTSLGHAVRSAPTAEQGLELARKDPPDLIILDVKLPGMDGLSALEEIRKLRPEARVIIITAHGTLETEGSSRADAFWTRTCSILNSDPSRARRSGQNGYSKSSQPRTRPTRVHRMSLTTPAAAS